MTKVIVIGAGQWGKNLVRTFYELHALSAIVETDPRLRAALLDQYPDIPVLSNYEQALETINTAIVIATPASTHFALAKQALEKGKDVFIEKPMTLSVRDAEELVEIANNNNLILMVGHLLLYQPAIQKIKACLKAGMIGNLQAVHQERLKLGRVRSIENVLWSFGVHDLAVFMYLIEESPARISVNGQRMIQPAIEDDVYVHLSFASGVHAHLHTSWAWPEIRRRLVAIGSEGMLVYDEEQQIVTLHKKGIQGDLSNRDEGSEIVYHGEVQPLTLECRHFLACLEERAQPLSDGKNGLEVIKILEQCSNLLQKELRAHE
ncbi:Gfo/Idh/MocA family protein [Paenibacillus naphthalenovorans]|uniref:NAD(P)-dependent oxidoreductase n=1 Tax=Paenibacillus naphthalenovorans TaxID=162209 RepID=A0A0U2UE33_9BACL|nr:Gfo/Idh/MocA family oxidoreductase [Paenibacillus naphthalenovorans]ALS24473.1 NAD(P)-dependent oxidoreductase [Paenibacillus naphthalenovorans]